ncbi:MAG TPA: alpha/beta fold hydrolase [Thermoanaerobaculia bacterium]|nr:alpha/beta fold hydrolase [Thermoanaerobaculia bacterium]
MIVAIHGFFGRPEDWDFLRHAGLDVQAFPLDEIPPSGDVLLGYSMGGRLALQALLDGARYNRAVIVSAGLGGADAGRRAADEAWARRFESDRWETLVADWEAQPLFGGHTMNRRESDFDRAALASALRRHSPAVLPPLRPRLHEIAIPLLWIAGERDRKYVGVAQEAVALLPNAELWICPGAAHRVPWEQPHSFVRRLQAL